MNMQSITPPWWRRKSKQKKPPNIFVQNTRDCWVFTGMLGAAVLLLVLLSGCCQPEVVYRKPEPYPLPPANLMQPPLNNDLIPPSLLPPKTAKDGLKTR